MYPIKPLGTPMTYQTSDRDSAADGKKLQLPFLDVLWAVAVLGAIFSLTPDYRILFADDKLTITFVSSRSVHVGLINRVGIIANRSGFIFRVRRAHHSFVSRNCV
jgi:hypothetical protein